MPTNGFIDYQGNVTGNSGNSTTPTSVGVVTTEANSLALFFQSTFGPENGTFNAPWIDTNWITTYGNIGYQIVNPAGAVPIGTASVSPAAQWVTLTLSLGLVGNTLPATPNHGTISGAWNSTATATFVSPTTAGNIILAFQMSYDVISYSTPFITDTAGNTYPLIANIGGSGGFPLIQVWLVSNCRAGATSATLHANGGFFAGAAFQVREFPLSIPNPTIFLQATPAIISEGTPSNVSWVTTNATSLTSNEFGSIPLSGSQVVTPPATDFYHFHAVGVGGTTDAVIEVEVLSNEAAFNLQKVILSMKQDRIPVRGKN